MIAVAVGLFFLYINPTYEDVKALKTVDASYDQALQNANELETVLGTLVTKYNGFPEESLNRLRKLLPDNVDNIKLLLEIDSMATRNKMTLKNVKFEQQKDSSVEQTNSAVKEKNKDYGKYQLQFTTEGSYPNFVAFLKEVETNLRLVDVESVAFSSPDLPLNVLNALTPGKGRDVYKYDITMNTFWLKN